MKNLIAALTIFAKYKDLEYPTHCEHDVLQIVGISEDEVSAEDSAALEKLGFFYSAGEDGWISFHYGSA